jgi:NAD(P)-dependent dehydrogenase (short-subunit alcohol dehydrogenase family)
MSDMHGRVCLITGATSGIGKAAAEALAKRGAHVVLVARNQLKGAAVRQELIEASQNTQIDLLVADFSSLKAVVQLAEQVRQNYPHLHVLVNNAGGIFFGRQTTTDGFEMSFGVNHLAHFVLTTELLDLLKASAPARVITISSNAEAVGRIHFDDLQRERFYWSFGAYAQSKLANLLFSYELARRVAGSGVVANAVTPGPVATNFGSGGNGMLRMFPWIFQQIGTSPEQAAATIVQLASDPAFAQINGKAFYQQRELQTSSHSYDLQIQQRLWQVSEQLVAPFLPRTEHHAVIAGDGGR